jgi:deltex-like protein
VEAILAMMDTFGQEKMEEAIRSSKKSQGIVVDLTDDVVDDRKPAAFKQKNHLLDLTCDEESPPSKKLPRVASFTAWSSEEETAAATAATTTTAAATTTTTTTTNTEEDAVLEAERQRLEYYSDMRVMVGDVETAVARKPESKKGNGEKIVLADGAYVRRLAAAQKYYDGDAALARKLAAPVVVDYADGDAALARKLARQLRKQERVLADKDAHLAAKLHQEEIQAAQHSKQVERMEMLSTTTGKATLFVEKILQAHENVISAATFPAIDASKISAVAKDDMVFLAERMLEAQETFQKNGIDPTVDIGYHYTAEQHMDKIRVDGLMTRSDRQSAGAGTHSNGAAFGDGIYTANNPFVFRHFGAVGLLVARLKGMAVRLVPSQKKGNSDSNSVVGNKGNGLPTTMATMGDFHDEIVLRTSAQVLPLIRFCNSFSQQSGSAESQAIHEFHQILQQTVDQFFNDGNKTSLTTTAVPPGYVLPANMANPSAMLNQVLAPLAPSSSSSSSSVSSSSSSLPSSPSAAAAAAATAAPSALSVTGPFQPRGHKRYKYRSMPQPPGSAAMAALSSALASTNTIPFVPGGVRVPTGTTERVSYSAPSTMPSDAASVTRNLSRRAIKADCSICLDPLRCPEKVVSLRVCDHEFHLTCITESLTHSNICPACRKPVSEPQGKSPTGTMTISRSAGITCQGFTSQGSIVIQYNIPAAVQLRYHENPGTPHGGATRTAYLPDNPDGNNLLQRLKYAFQGGLTFTVGTSMTAATPNSVTWSSIHHKTSPSGGVLRHGFPDPSYFLNVGVELDGLGVPDANELLRNVGHTMMKRQQI